MMQGKDLVETFKLPTNYKHKSMALIGAQDHLYDPEVSAVMVHAFLGQLPLPTLVALQELLRKHPIVLPDEPQVASHDGLLVEPH